jgi:hypothetical protein
MLLPDAQVDAKLKALSKARWASTIVCSDKERKEGAEANAPTCDIEAPLLLSPMQNLRCDFGSIKSRFAVIYRNGMHSDVCAILQQGLSCLP